MPKSVISPYFICTERKIVHKIKFLSEKESYIYSAHRAMYGAFSASE